MLVNYIGLDLGQAADYSTLALIEAPVWVPGWWALPSQLPAAGWVSPDQLIPQQVGSLPIEPPIDLPTLTLRGLKRYPLGTSYPAVVRDVQLLLTRLIHRDRTVLLIDKTGVGAAVFDMFVGAGLAPIGVMIHGGDVVNRDGMTFRVPKRDLVSAVQALLQTSRLRFAERLPDLPALKAELKSFKVRIDPKTAHDSYSAWRESDHDDLVLAVALACWYQQTPYQIGAAWPAAALRALSGRRRV